MCSPRSIAEAQRILEMMAVEHARQVRYAERIPKMDAERRRKAFSDAAVMGARWEAAQGMFLLLHPEFKGRIAKRR